MKCISIQQPWAYLIAQGIKDIENRDWTTDYRGLILIYAGKKLDPACFDGDELHSPAIYRMGGGPNIRALIPSRKEDYETGGIVGYATLQKVVTSHTSPWFCGKYGFVLTQRHPVDLIPCKGRLGLFDVPAEIEAEIDEIRERRFWEAEMKEQYQIKKEWDEYKHEGDETPPWKHGGIAL